MSRKVRAEKNGITHPGGVGSDLSGLIELPALEKLLVLLDIQIVRSRKISPTSELEGQFGIVQCREDIRNDGIFVDIHAQNLALLVDTNDTVRSLVFSRNEDGLAGNPVHVDTRARFEVVEVNETVFGDQEHNSVLF